MGLGLAIVQRLGNLLGHNIDVRSRPGRGSVFAIEVALAPKEVRSVAPKAIEGESEEIAAGNGSILIVEDDPALRYSLEHFLRADGHRMAAAADGEEAILLVARKDAQPDMVIVDYDLPKGLTGLQVVARLREMLGHDLPALILTGDISTETLSEIARQGYIQRSKPIRAKELTRLVRSMLAKRP